MELKKKKKKAKPITSDVLAKEHLTKAAAVLLT